MPEVPRLPAAPAQYPDTDGGQVAKALDLAADELVREQEPSDERLRQRQRQNMHPEAFAPIDNFMNGLPKQASNGRVWLKVDAAADRALIDTEFERFWQAWWAHREVIRRMKIRSFLYQRKKYARPDDDPPTAEQIQVFAAPGQVQRINTSVDGEWNIVFSPANWFEVNAVGGNKAKWMVGGGTILMGGRVQFQDRLELMLIGPVGVRLAGRCGQLIVTTVGHTVLDFWDLQAPYVEVNGGHENMIVRVGPGVQKLKVSPKASAIVLARGAPGLQVEIPPTGRTDLLVVAY